MGFTSWDTRRLSPFNSQTSAKFLEFYQSKVEDKLRAKASEPPHQTFAASSFRCNRKSWFRLRGTQPDSIKTVDTALEFTAEIGTACHRMIQSNLREFFGDAWIDPVKYVDSLVFARSVSGYTYKCTLDESGLEALVEISDPPIRFACDGIVQYEGKTRLVEIKTCEFSSWSNLTEPKPQHIDQVKCYCTLLHLDSVLFLYQDRQYGGYKCYELDVTPEDKQRVSDTFRYVLDMVDKNLAPEGLPKGDPWCTPSMCPYYRTCGEYGRY